MPTVKLGQSSKRRVNRGTRVLKTCESGHRHSILVDVINFDEIGSSNRQYCGRVDIGIDHWGQVVAIADIIDELNIDNGNAYHTEKEECKARKKRTS